MGRGEGEFVVVVIGGRPWGTSGNFEIISHLRRLGSDGGEGGGGRIGEGGSSGTCLYLSLSLYRFACGIERCKGEAISSAVGRWVDLG